MERVIFVCVHLFIFYFLHYGQMEHAIKHSLMFENILKWLFHVAFKRKVIFCSIMIQKYKIFIKSKYQFSLKTKETSCIADKK